MAELIKKTFIDILKNENIIVPEIQREYVWGSEENIENCKKLLNDIIDNTENNYNIGFLYSYEKDNKVYLIDGQQRFTTLYLTLLYLSVKENKKEEDKKHLEKFSYKVRNLTKEFIDLMIEKIEKTEDFIDIENKTWCLSVYKKDPTIKNIINFFSIFKEDKYKKISLSDIEKAEFWYFNTSNTSQGEELYITMNSRGEKIAEYEDIRVSLLSEIPEKYYKDRATKFNKIEHFFWKHRYEGKNNADNEFNKFLKQVIALSKFESKESELNAINKMDNIIYRYNSLELLYTVLESENKQYLSELNNDKNILNEEKIVEETENNQEESTGSDETEKLKAALEHLNNQYLRLAADFDNYRKRQAQEREALLKYGTEECMKKVIEVVDNFERAIKSVEKIDNVDKMKETFFVLNKQLTDSLTKLGLEEIKCVGEKFDPILHEAVLQTKTEEYPEETVTQELQKGYKLGDKVLRPAMVAVAVKE